MAQAMRSPPGSVRRHARNISRTVPEPATEGPLNAVDDPLANASFNPQEAPAADVAQPRASLQSQSTSTPPPPPPQSGLIERPIPIVDLRFLQDRHIYHTLTTEDIPSAFLSSTNRPPGDTSLPDLLQAGHFRRAAETALRALYQTPSSASEKLLELLYTRLACLVLISRPDVAAAEAVPLIDLLARNPPGTRDLIDILPWHLRLLLVRLQSMGAVDGGRRGIMALYALAGEVRASLRQAQCKGDSSAVDKWRERLQDLSLRVCDALVEMGELETASRHLDTLSGVDAQELAYRRALLRLRVGDVVGARSCVDALQDDMKKRGFEALLQVGDGDYSSAVTSWQGLAADYPNHEDFVLNAAVSLLYTGHMASARRMLEDASQRFPMFPTLLFNLSTVYELCTERALERKTALAHQIASRKPAPDSGGWERATFEFKL